MEKIKKIPDLIQQLYRIVTELENLFPNRPFTLDGHLVGSIGEVLAAHLYNLELLPCSTECHDAKSKSGKLIQIKATQGKSVGLRYNPKHLIVLRITRNGSTEEIYNGPGELAWNHAGKMQKNGQKSISTNKLHQLMQIIPSDAKLAMGMQG